MINLATIPICVINLPTRVERLKRTVDECIKFFGESKDRYLHVIPGVTDSIPQKGIAQAHINAVKFAKLNDWKNVLIMEDDVRFQTKHAYSYAQEALISAPENFDILLGGIYNHKGPITKINGYWNKIDEFCGLHFYIINEKAYDTVLACDKKMHIDRWLAKVAKLDCYVVESFFVTQHDGYSDNAQKNESYEHLLKKYKVLI